MPRIATQSPVVSAESHAADCLVDSTTVLRYGLTRHNSDAAQRCPDEPRKAMSFNRNELQCEGGCARVSRDSAS